MRDLRRGVRGQVPKNRLEGNHPRQILEVHLDSKLLFDGREKRDTGNRIPSADIVMISPQDLLLRQRWENRRKAAYQPNLHLIHERPPRLWAVFSRGTRRLDAGSPCSEASAPPRAALSRSLAEARFLPSVQNPEPSP